MESKINTIGLTIWGYKQGCKVLASQGVNFQLQEVKDRLKDISAFIRIHTPRVDFYTLQFSNSYKIYTQYRSSKEVNGQSGVYIAISLYIPHFLQWRGVRQVLNLLMDMYFAEHINYENNIPLLNEKEDIFPYFNLLRGYEKQLVEEPVTASFALDQSYMPKVFPYMDIYEVDKYFNMPYRPEFEKYQDLVFLRKEFVEDPRAYSIDFLFPEYAIPRTSTSTFQTTNAGGSGGASRFLPSNANIKILAFMKNGKDVGATYMNEVFSDDDTIEVLLEKSRYHEMFSYHDTIKKAIKRGYIKKVQNNYTFDLIPFAPKEFKVYVETPQREFEKYISFLSLESTTFKAKLYSNTKGYYFLLKGDEARNVFNLSYNGIVFKSNYMVDDRVSLSVPFEKYQFTIISSTITSVSLKINGIVFSKNLRSDSPVEIVLPENLYHFEFENQDTGRVISISKSGEVNFDRAKGAYNPQMIASESPEFSNGLSVVNRGVATTERGEAIKMNTKSRAFWIKIASAVAFVLILVGVGYWFIFPMLKNPVKAYVAINSESEIDEMHFLTNIDERTYEIEDSYIRLKKSLPIAETKLVVSFKEEGKDTLLLNEEQLNKLAKMVEANSKDTLKIDLISPAMAFLLDVNNWKETHADPKGSLFIAEAQKRNFLTDKLRPEFEKAVWENFLKDFDYSAYNSEQVDSLLRPYLKGGSSELKSYQTDLQRIIRESKARDQVEVAVERPKREEQPATKPEATVVNRNETTVGRTPKTVTPSYNTERPVTISEPRDPKTVKRGENTTRPIAKNVSLTETFVTDMKRFNSQACSEEVVDRVKMNLKRLEGNDWSVVMFEFNQGRREIEERANQYSMFFTALKNGTSIDQVKPSYFGGQTSLINYLKKGTNYELVKGKANLKTFADIRQAIVNMGVDPKTIR